MLYLVMLSINEDRYIGGTGACKRTRLTITDNESLLIKFRFALFEISATVVFSSQQSPW